MRHKVCVLNLVVSTRYGCAHREGRRMHCIDMSLLTFAGSQDCMQAIKILNDDEVLLQGSLATARTDAEHRRQAYRQVVHIHGHLTKHLCMPQCAMRLQLARLNHACAHYGLGPFSAVPAFKKEASSSQINKEWMALGR
jgi:hypothetical protein